MELIFFGMSSLVLFMLCVMLTPLIHYLKLERQWLEAGQTREAWYKG